MYGHASSSDLDIDALCLDADDSDCVLYMFFDLRIGKRKKGL